MVRTRPVAMVSGTSRRLLLEGDLGENRLEHVLFAGERARDALVDVGPGQVDIEAALGHSAHTMDAILYLRARIETVRVLEEEHRPAWVILGTDERVTIFAGIGLQQHE